MLCTLLALVAFSAAADAPMYDAELIFPIVAKEGDISTVHNHGSSIVECPNGDLLACWFSGKGERQSDDVRVMGARKPKGATAWSAPFLMADTPNLPDCNPVLFIDPQKKLWLFWITVQDNQWGGSLLKYRTSTDYSGEGAPKWEWQDVIHARPTNLEPKVLAALDEAEQKYAQLLAAAPKIKGDLEGLRAKASNKLAQRLGWMTRLHPIMTSDNRMMLGLYSDVWNCSLAAFTEDGGQTWSFSEPIITYAFGNIQPAFAKRSDGTIVAFMRDNGIPKKIRRAESKDNGVTWGEVTELDIPNPGSSVDVVALKNGHWVLLCNDQPEGRHRLTAYLSTDEGNTWTAKRPLEDFAPDKGSGSYPSIIQAADGTIHCTYSYDNQTEMPGGQSIKHAHFNEEWITAAPAK
jgi:predicted neuraminidase